MYDVFKLSHNLVIVKDIKHGKIQFKKKNAF